MCPFWKGRFSMTWQAFVDQVFFFPWHCHWQKAGSRSLHALSKRSSPLQQWGGPWELVLALERIIEIIFFFQFYFYPVPTFSSKGDWRSSQWQRHTLHIARHTDLQSSFYDPLHQSHIHILNEILVSMPLAGWSHHLFLLHILSCTTTRSVLFSSYAKEQNFLSFMGSFIFW